MEPTVTNAEIQNMYSEGMTAETIARDIATRMGRDYDKLRTEGGYNDNQIIQALVPTFRPSISGEEARIPQRMNIDIESFGDIPAEQASAQLAQYLAAMAGRNYDALKEQRFTDDQIIAALASEESVRMLPGVQRAIEETLRGVTRAAPSFLAGTGAAVLGAPAGPLTSAGAGVAAAMAAEPYGAALEEAIFGENVPPVPGQRGQQQFGRILGLGIPFIFAPHMAARNYSPTQLAFMAQRTERFKNTPIDELIMRATYQPRSLLASEALSLGGAAAGGAFAEAMAPGNEAASILGEIAGGVVAPGQLITDQVLNLAQRIQTGTSGAMARRAENTLARLVGELARDFGESPRETADLLMAARSGDEGIAALAERYGVDPGVLRTVGLADTPVLRTLNATIENSVGRLGPTQARARRGELTRNLEAVGTMIQMLRGTGDPNLVAEAARLEDNLFRTTLQANLDSSVSEAARTAERLVSDDPTAIQRAGERIEELTYNSLRDARRQERQVWGEVDRNLSRPLTNTARIVEGIFEDLRPTRRLETFNIGPIRNTIRELSRKEGGPTVGDLLALKRNLFEQMQNASSGSNPRYGDARRYGEIYEAVMEDLAAEGGNEALNRANAFSRALNDVYTRAFPNTALGRDARGANRIPPELLGRRILTGGGDATDSRLRQLDDAVNFVIQQSDDPAIIAAAEDRLGTMRSQQEILLRSIAARAVNPQTGELNLTVLRRLTNPDNPSGIAAALQRFDGLRRDLENAETAQLLLREVMDDNSQAIQAHDAQKWFGALVDGDPAEAVSLAIASPANRPDNAADNLRSLIRIARQAGGDEFVDLAQRGLVDTIMDRAAVYSGAADGQTDFRAMREFLFEPLGRGQPNTVMILRDAGIFTDRQLADLNTLLRQGETISNALRGSQTDQELLGALQEVSPITLGLVGRFLGAREGARIQRVMGGAGTIQIPGYFANLGARLAERVPTTKLQDVLTRFLEEPEFAELILRKADEFTTARRPSAIRSVGNRVFNSLENSMIRNGLILGASQVMQEITEDDFELPIPEVGAAEAATLPARPQPAPAPAPTAPPPMPSPQPSQQGALPPAAPLPQPPRAGGQPRASYSALFPNDPISPMLQQREMQQGIGSLMGGR